MLKQFVAWTFFIAGIYSFYLAWKWENNTLTKEEKTMLFPFILLGFAIQYLGIKTAYNPLVLLVPSAVLLGIIVYMEHNKIKQLVKQVLRDFINGFRC